MKDKVPGSGDTSDSGSPTLLPYNPGRKGEGARAMGVAAARGAGSEQSERGKGGHDGHRREGLGEHSAKGTGMGENLSSGEQSNVTAMLAVRRQREVLITASIRARIQKYGSTRLALVLSIQFLYFRVIEHSFFAGTSGMEHGRNRKPRVGNGGCSGKAQGKSIAAPSDLSGRSKSATR